ncbi:hypothetical protein M758_UG012300 [Ceratodon purpureus]|nr:hypothetical protein M758_UG012300 [Ceratodon purpureus]
MALLTWTLLTQKATIPQLNFGNKLNPQLHPLLSRRWRTSMTRGRTPRWSEVMSTSKTWELSPSRREEGDVHAETA